MSIALLFPGQGGLACSRAVELLPHSPLLRELLAIAREETGCDPSKLLRHGGPALVKTAVLQPILTALSLGIAGELLAAGIQPSHVAGLSLGEVAAASAAGHFAPEVAVRFAARRGELMGREAGKHPGAMAALFCESESELQQALRVASEHGSIVVAGRNGPKHWILSGDKSAISALRKLRDAVLLAVEGAWHSPAMRGALPELRACIEQIGFAPAERCLFSSIEPGPVDAGRLPTLLLEQLIRPCDFHAMLEGLHAAGVDVVLTLADGKVLRSLVQASLGRAVRVVPVEDWDGLRSCLEEFA